jgi:hypothetical protein
VYCSVSVPVCEVGSHDEIVLHHEGGLLGVHNESLNNLGGCNSLFGVQIGRGLINLDSTQILGSHCEDWKLQ